jgi:hypothetical protein
MFSKRLRTKLINFYPPLLGAGIKVTYQSPDHMKYKVKLKLRWWNRNLVGVHYGGSLFSMCDPFYMIILLEKLSKDYIVWDKAASIRFIHAGKSDAHATFEITYEQLEQIKKEVDESGKKDFTFKSQVFDEQKELLAEVEKVVYIRRKDLSTKQEN